MPGLVGDPCRSPGVLRTIDHPAAISLGDRGGELRSAEGAQFGEVAGQLRKIVRRALAQRGVKITQRADTGRHGLPPIRQKHCAAGHMRNVLSGSDIPSFVGPPWPDHSVTVSGDRGVDYRRNRSLLHDPASVPAYHHPRTRFVGALGPGPTDSRTPHDQAVKTMHRLDGPRPKTSSEAGLMTPGTGLECHR
jgi:hypothetical protein